MPKTKKPVSSTECVHAGAGPCEVDSSLITPIVHSAPFVFDSTRDIGDYFDRKSARQQPEYGRMGNPTVRCVELRLAALDGAEKSQLFGSGMMAIITAFLHILKSGDHLILTADVYKRTRTFCETFLPKFGVRVSIVPPTLEAIRSALDPSTRIIFTECPTNPYLWVIDVPGLAALGRERQAITIVDSTFATPVNFRPLDHGIDLVVHSATKYLGGHNDLIAGVLSGRAELVQPISVFLSTLGGICDPNTAFLLERGLKTLAIRVEKHNTNGMTVARHLESHPKVRKVYYPGLPSHPCHAIASSLMSGFGGVVTFAVRSDRAGTTRFVDSLKIPRLAPSLGGIESLVQQVATMAYWCLSADDLKRIGITDDLVRFSVGIEDAEDIIADIDQALSVL